jgi:hypothetical protein
MDPVKTSIYAMEMDQGRRAAERGDWEDAAAHAIYALKMTGDPPPSDLVALRDEALRHIAARTVAGMGGKSTSARKAAAARRNGAKGGRPRQ